MDKPGLYVCMKLYICMHRLMRTYVYTGFAFSSSQKAFHPFSLYAGRFFQTILIGLTSFAQSFPELCLKFYQIHLLLAEGLSQKRDKAKVFLYEISDEPGFLEPNKNSWTSCSYNYRVSEGRVGYKIKEEMI